MRSLRKRPALQEQLILAVDVDEPARAIDIISRVRESVSWYKLRQNILLDEEGRGEVVGYLKDNDLSILADFQSATTESQLRQLVELSCDFGFDAISIKADVDHMHAAVCGIDDLGKALGVCSPILLTQMGVGDAGFGSLEDISKFVTKQSIRAAKHGLDGVITSCREIPELPEDLKNDLIFITPGIRDAETGMIVTNDNQRRTCSISEAISNGADYLMVGRPVIQADCPEKIVKACLGRMDQSRRCFWEPDYTA